MGARASTSAGGSGASTSQSFVNTGDARSRALSTSAGSSGIDSNLGILRSSSHSNANTGSNSIGSNGNNNVTHRERVVGDRGRTRSLSRVPGESTNVASLSIPALLSRATGASPIRGIGSESSGTEGSSPEDYASDGGPFSMLGLNRVFATHSLPAHLWSLNGFKCPVCRKLIVADDLECHLVMCLTKPRISYNEDTLMELKGECVICLDDLEEGDKIARLPCLCIYHKKCIDDWFLVNRSCPEHPYD